VDFQFIVVDKVSSDLVSGLIDGEDLDVVDSRDQVLCLPPPLFSRTDEPQNYDFREAVSKDPTDAKGPKNFALIMSANSASIPTEPHPRAGVDPELQPMVDELRKLFAVRPIWSRIALRMHLPFRTGAHLVKLLPSVAFYWKQGPWGRLWTRFGYDPRTTPEARWYQMVDFRVSKSLWDRVTKVKAAAPAPVGNTDLFMPYRRRGEDPSKRVSAEEFDAIEPGAPGRRQHLLLEPPENRQLYFILQDLTDHDDDLKAYVEGLDIPSTCHERWGWLPDGVDDIRPRLVSKLKAMLPDNGNEDDKEQSRKGRRPPKASEEEAAFQHAAARTTVPADPTSGAEAAEDTDDAGLPEHPGGIADAVGDAGNVGAWLGQGRVEGDQDDVYELLDEEETEDESEVEGNSSGPDDDADDTAENDPVRL